MIGELYLKKALNIRKEYLNITKDINSYEKVAKDLISSIQFRKDEMEVLSKKLSEGRFSNPENAQMEFSKILFELEKDINEVNMRIDGLNDRIEKLKQEELTLYKDIKNQYPESKDEDLKKEIKEYFDKMNVN
jgi:chromosome segregation ATPase